MVASQLTASDLVLVRSRTSFTSVIGVRRQAERPSILNLGKGHGLRCLTSHAILFFYVPLFAQFVAIEVWEQHQRHSTRTMDKKLTHGEFGKYFGLNLISTSY